MGGIDDAMLCKRTTAHRSKHHAIANGGYFDTRPHGFHDAGAIGEEVGAEHAAGDHEDDGEDDGSPEYADDLNDFIPSSEVPPDEQVTFPVDI